MDFVICQLDVLTGQDICVIPESQCSPARPDCDSVRHWPAQYRHQSPRLARRHFRWHQEGYSIRHLCNH